MPYQTEFRFLKETLAKIHVKTALLAPGEVPTEAPDMGLRRFLGQTEDYLRFSTELPRQIQPNTIYKLTDSYLCSYLFLRLPSGVPSVLLLGPYLTVSPTRQQIMESAEQYQLPPHLLRQLESYYGSLPYLNDESFLLAVVNTFAESLWGSTEAYTMTNLTAEPADRLSYAPAEEAPAPEQTLLNMQAMERRYAFENEMLQAVSQGLSHKAQLMLSHLGELSMEQRTADPLRNLKNYCIVMNTLLRKAAEKGGVHPLYLDTLSSGFARQIEITSATPAIHQLMTEMAQSYCRLVKKHATDHYSTPVRQALTCIDTDLSGDLSLHALATMQNLSPGYLSALFRKETGHTLTDYVNTKRMEHAANLLRTTALQVQTVAQYCGITDVNYFSKVFKRYMGCSPKEFRQSPPHRSERT